MRIDKIRILFDELENFVITRTEFQKIKLGQRPQA